MLLTTPLHPSNINQSVTCRKKIIYRKKKLFDNNLIFNGIADFFLLFCSYIKLININRGSEVFYESEDQDTVSDNEPVITIISTTLIQPSVVKASLIFTLHSQREGKVMEKIYTCISDFFYQGSTGLALTSLPFCCDLIWLKLYKILFRKLIAESGSQKYQNI